MLITPKESRDIWLSNWSHGRWGEADRLLANYSRMTSYSRGCFLDAMKYLVYWSASLENTIHDRIFNTLNDFYRWEFPGKPVL